MFAGETISTPPPGAWLSTGDLDRSAARVEGADDRDHALVLGVGARVLAALARSPTCRPGPSSRRSPGRRRSCRPPSSFAPAAGALIAPTICVVCRREPPCRGRSVAMRTSGSPSPSYSSGAQDDDGSADTSPVRRPSRLPSRRCGSRRRRRHRTPPRRAPAQRSDSARKAVQLLRLTDPPSCHGVRGVSEPAPRSDDGVTANVGSSTDHRCPRWAIGDGDAADGSARAAASARE